MERRPPAPEGEKRKNGEIGEGIIQQGMLRNNPRHVTESVNEATEVLGGMLNTHKCLLESGEKIFFFFWKKMESHPAMKKLGNFQRPRSASLGDTPKNPAKGEKRSSPSPPLKETAKRGKRGSSPSYAQVATSQPPNEQGDWHVVTKKKKKKGGRRHQGVGEGRPVLRRHLEGNEGEGRHPEGRT